MELYVWIILVLSIFSLRGETEITRAFKLEEGLLNLSDDHGAKLALATQKSLTDVLTRQLFDVVMKILQKILFC